MDNAYDRIHRNLFQKGRDLSAKYPFLRPCLTLIRKIFFTNSKILGSGLSQDSVIDAFHKLYYGIGDQSPVWRNTYWLGYQTVKCPLDLWVYQEIIAKIQPDLIIETGTWNGGSALYLATICDAIKKGTIISIDIKKNNFPNHARIKYLTGSSIDPKILSQVRDIIESIKGKVLVILDSDHLKEHVLKEMEIYGKFVSKDSYLIVEDTNVNGHPIMPEHGDGPMEAIREFLKTHTEFVIDKESEKFLMTFNPNGYLKKIR